MLAFADYLGLYARPRVLLMLALGFASGLPWMLSGATLLAWLTGAGVHVVEISAFSLVGLPYSLKLLWAPLIDRWAPFSQARLGRRRGWMAMTQLLLCATLYALGRATPQQMPLRIGVLAVLCAFLSATQDIAVDAYRSDLLHPDEAGAGTACFVLGYRIAMIVSGALALRLADVWQQDFGRVYQLMAILLLPAVLLSLWGPCEDKTRSAPLRSPRTLRETVIAPLAEFFGRQRAVRVLLFILLYRLGDVVLTSMVVPFLLRSGYSNTEVADATKLLGLVASILGALCGGSWVSRLGLGRALFAFGGLQTITHLGYALIAAQHAPSPALRLGLLYAIVAIDQFCAGLVIAASGALLLLLCDRRYSATQYALLSSASSLAGRVVAGASGLFIARFGWQRFFLLTAVLSLPALLLLRSLRGRLHESFSGSLPAPTPPAKSAAASS